MDILGLSRAAGATKIDAQDAIIEYNGVEYTGNSNTFELNGLTITAKGVTGTYDKTTGVFTNNTAVNVEVGADTEGVYNTIKNFVKKYNELIDEMNTLYNEKKPEYEPLTDEEKKNIEGLCDDLQKSVDAQDIEAIKSKKGALEKAAQDLATRVYQQNAEQQNQGGSSNDSGNGKDDNVVDADYSDVN